MTERTMSPSAAQAHAKRAIRSRYKAIRLGKRVESPQILAVRLAGYAEATSKAFPVEPSKAYREYVETTFHERYIELCRTTPLAVRR